MHYKLIKINTVSKFSVVNLAIAQNKFRFGNKKIPDVICLNTFFWKMMFLPKFLLQFISKCSISKNDWIKIKFCLVNLPKIYSFLLANQNIPTGDQIYFSYVILNYIINYLNNTLKVLGSNYIITLRHGILFKGEILSIDDILINIERGKRDKFLYNLYYKFFEKYTFLKKKKLLFVIKVFWPHEIIQAGIIGYFIKFFFGDKAKVALDLGSANEQFDFSQWDHLFISNTKFNDYFDFIIFDRNYVGTYTELLNYLNKDKNKLELSILDYSKINNFNNERKEISLEKNWVEFFLETTLTSKNVVNLYGKKTLFGRLLPYKCYRSKCSFCAINKQNPYLYDPKIGYDVFIDKWINFIISHKIEAVTFKDEAIPPKIIFNFCKKLIGLGLKVQIQFRTRFEKFYTQEVCEVLAKAGCAYCGIGLESASERINSEIANKGSNLSLKEKQEIISNFEKAGISFHIYSIIGFPTEDKTESLATYLFLKNNIINSNFVTCTPNIFYLMKGTNLFYKRKQFNIEVSKKQLNNPFLLSYKFTVNGKEIDYNFLKKLVDDLHYTQFLPWLRHSKLGIYYAKDFWDFIDRSYIFYLLKQKYIKNPFRLFTKLTKKNNKNIHYVVSPYIQYLGDGKLFNWINNKTLLLAKQDIEIIFSEDLKKGVLYTFLDKKFSNNYLLTELVENMFLIPRDYFINIHKFLRH